MTRYRSSIPQLTPYPFLTDGGLETTLIYHDGLELPDFAAFHLLRTPEGTATLAKYYRRYADIARQHHTGLILESATWRASLDWGRRLGYTAAQLVDVNRRAIDLLEELRAEYASPSMQVIISGCVGPRGDGYVAQHRMSISEAERYHRPQIATFASTVSDIITAMTINYIEEAVGIAHAARAVGMPVAISLTVETDGRLPTGDDLASALVAIDAATDAYPAYYLINCAHPSHFAAMVRDGNPIWGRLRGLRANASALSHAELNALTELDAGNPEEFGAAYASLRQDLPWLTILGGCCGTDHRHVEAVASQLRQPVGR